MFRKITDTYRWLHNHPQGRWALALVWFGLLVAAAFCGERWVKTVVESIPLLLERKALAAAAGATFPPSGLDRAKHLWHKMRARRAVTRRSWA